MFSPIVQEILSKARPDDFKEANRRYAVIIRCLEGGSPKKAKLPLRTVNRWLKRWRDAESTFGCGYIGLLPQHYQKGNRQRKLPKKTMAMLTNFMATDYGMFAQKPKSKAYGALVRACKERGIRVPSYKTFVKEVKLASQEQMVNAFGK